MEATQMSIDGWKDKQNVVYPYSGMLFSFKKEGNSDICYNIIEPWRPCVEWSKPGTVKQILYDSTYVLYLETSNS